MRFSYRRYRVRHSESDPPTIVYRPVIPIDIHSNGVSIRRSALIDTGADYTLLPTAVADYLGLPLDGRHSIVMSGIGDEAISASLAEVEFELGHGQQTRRWRTAVYVAQQNHLLLGNEGFLEFFIATFDWANKTIDLVPNSRLPKTGRDLVN